MTYREQVIDELIRGGPACRWDLLKRMGLSHGHPAGNELPLMRSAGTLYITGWKGTGKGKPAAIYAIRRNGEADVPYSPNHAVRIPIAQDLEAGRGNRKAPRPKPPPKPEARRDDGAFVHTLVDARHAPAPAGLGPASVFDFALRCT